MAGDGPAAAAAQRDVDKKVTETRAFLELKEMMRSKAEEVKKLKLQLIRYMPQQDDDAIDGDAD